MVVVAKFSDVDVSTIKVVESPKGRQGTFNVVTATGETLVIQFGNAPPSAELATSVDYFMPQKVGLVQDKNNPDSYLISVRLPKDHPVVAKLTEIDNVLFDFFKANNKKIDKTRFRRIAWIPDKKEEEGGGPGDTAFITFKTKLQRDTNSFIGKAYAYPDMTNAKELSSLLPEQPVVVLGKISTWNTASGYGGTIWIEDVLMGPAPKKGGQRFIVESFQEGVSTFDPVTVV